MPTLKNTRWELFCQGLLEGKTADQAYEDAGYSPNAGNAIRLKGNERIQARLEELKAEAAKFAVMDKAWVLRELRRTYEMAIGERLIGDREDGGYGFHPAAAKGILELVGKDQGMFPDKVNIDQTNREVSPTASSHNLEILRRLGASGSPPSKRKSD